MIILLTYSNLYKAYLGSARMQTECNFKPTPILTNEVSAKSKGIKQE